MKKLSKILFLFMIMALLFGVLMPNKVYAKSNKIDEIIENMSNEDKIAMMIMPAFRDKSGVATNEDNIRDLLSSYGFAGVILFAENTGDTESTMRFIDLLQDSNKNNPSRLLIATDQEGGYVVRLGNGTVTPGNMALAATNYPDNAYESAKIIGSELKTIGINTNFAPVVDVNSNPSNPVIGIRSFSDDPNIVATYSEKFMEGLHSEGIITSLKHFPGHGDTSTDTHTGLSIINKSYDELKNSELVPFQQLVNSGTDMIMTAHIQYPNIETETYVSKKDGNTYTLPATLSKTILTDILRKDMGYEGVIVTDALDMKAIAENFGIVDASIKAINAGADILLMPYIYDSDINEFKDYISTLASKVGTEISLDNVNSSVRRVLELKQKNGLLEEYDNSDLEERIINAKSSVSSKDNHSKEFNIAKEAITMVKNEDSVLPLSGDEKTVVLYEYGSHVKEVNNALYLLKKEEGFTGSDNISLYPFYDENYTLPLDTVKDVIKDAKNVIMIHSLYGTSGLSDTDIDKMNQLIDYVHGNNGKVVVMSTQLPYDVVKYKKADALVITYLANGMWFDLEEYEDNIPKYGPNVMAGIYMLYTKKDNMSGILPVNIYDIDENNNYIDEILYERGFGLNYYELADVSELKKVSNEVKDRINGDVKYTEESINSLNEVYNKVTEFNKNNKKPLVEKQNDVDSLVKEANDVLDNLKIVYNVIDGPEKINIANNEELSFKVDLDYEKFKNTGNVYVDNDLVNSTNYVSSVGNTVITFNDDYTKTLNEGNHTFKVTVNDGEASSDFTIVNESISPKTGDNVIVYVSILVLSLIGLIVLNKKIDIMN